MYRPNSFRQPEILKVGAKYRLVSNEHNIAQSKYEDVVFLSYTSSPEMVIVQTVTGQKFRVVRGNLYEENLLKRTEH